MADNISIADSGGTPRIILSDEITINAITGLAQRVKLVLGADGAYQGDLAFGQALRAASIPTTIASDQPAIPVSQTSLPLPTGAATEATLALLARAADLGAVADTAWSGTGNASLIAIEKAIWTKLAGALNVRGGAGNDSLAVRLTDGTSFYTAAGAKGATLTATTVTVGTTATLLLAANAARIAAVFSPQGATVVFIGPSSVTTSNGQDISNAKPFEDAMSTAAIYGIVAAGTVDVRVLALTP